MWLLPRQAIVMSDEAAQDPTTVTAHYPQRSLNSSSFLPHPRPAGARAEAASYPLPGPAAFRQAGSRQAGGIPFYRLFNLTPI